MLSMWKTGGYFITVSRKSCAYGSQTLHHGAHLGKVRPLASLWFAGATERFS